MTVCYHLNTEYDLKACQTLYNFLTLTKGLDISFSSLKIQLDSGEIDDRYCTMIVDDSGVIEYCGFTGRIITRTVDRVLTMHVYDFINLFKSRRIEL